MDHGPQLHGALLGVLVLVALVGGLVYLLVVRVKGRRHPDEQPAGDRSQEASDAAKGES